ncbi:alpha/beta hydrolase [Amycolatopsis sp. NPDC006131]|uniref:alpha/beta hydrolase n=1 Tax=Amycolatopsis sp. NPDC006131 TaxID=3156731 RepID=UPI0033A59C12
MTRAVEHRYFYVGGRYCRSAGKTSRVDQAYVHHLAPLDGRAAYPIVMIHGGGLTGLCWESTPDGRAGWADFFARRGFPTYVMDQPARGRSAWSPEEHGDLIHPEAGRIERHFTAIADFNLWERAKLHTRWPGSGRVGDPVFDQFFSSMVPFVRDRHLSERLATAAGTALLDEIGPAILMTHSQSGPHGWHIADARPDLVKAIIAIEPGGPPFMRHEEVGPPEVRIEVGVDKPWGIAATPLVYEPPVVGRAGLPYVREEEADAPNLVPAYVQADPPRRLPNLANIPVAVVTSEAGYHAAYDHSTVKFLRSAGVETDHIRLEEAGVHGNGHMLMIEQNSDEIAELLRAWLDDCGLAGPGASD